MGASKEKSNIKKKVEKAFIHQKDQSDCGVACLKSVTQYFGGDVKLERLRELSGTNRQGTTLLGLYQAANEIGLKAEAFEAEMKHLQELESPCILHIIKNKTLQHYIVYYGYENDKFLISDPAEGVKYISVDELERQWQSKALLLLNTSSIFATKREGKKHQWKWIKELVTEDLNILGLALALGIFITVLSLSTAIFSQQLIDNILPERDLLKLFLGVGLLTILLIARSSLSYIRQLFLIRQSRDFNNRVINSFYDSLLKLPVPFFFNRKNGDLIARMNDTRRLQQTATFLIADVTIDVLMVIVASVLMPK